METFVIICCLILAALIVVSIAIWIFGERWHLLLPSTRRIIQHKDANGTRLQDSPSATKPAAPRLGMLKQLEGYIYGRWTNQYIAYLIHTLVPRLDAAGRKKLADRYHGKVLTHDQAKAIIQLDQPICRDLEQVIPYPMARDLILSAPIEIAAYECACRHARAESCQPTQVCMVVGKGPVAFVLEHNPQSSRRLTQSEALEMLQAEHERGHLHSAWFKDAMQGRFYAICNCCKCCCGGIRNMKEYGVPAVASSGYVISVDPELCNACGNCADVCPFDSLTVNGSAKSDWDKCMGCGVCIDRCVTEALSLVRDERKGVPLDVRTFHQNAAATNVS